MAQLLAFVLTSVFAQTICAQEQLFYCGDQQYYPSQVFVPAMLTAASTPALTPSTRMCYAQWLAMVIGNFHVAFRPTFLLHATILKSTVQYTPGGDNPPISCGYFSSEDPSQISCFNNAYPCGVVSGVRIASCGGDICYDPNSYICPQGGYFLPIDPPYCLPDNATAILDYANTPYSLGGRVIIQCCPNLSIGQNDQCLTECQEHHYGNQQVCWE
ncbi:hypothetical protein C8R45DRAFT_937719 [Mycena sanguinolenta]|nr:hypothetical protein C8R45DRAFT_937719 [Mycena sanguinolenta]